MSFDNPGGQAVQPFRKLSLEVCDECGISKDDSCHFSTVQIDVRMHGEPVATDRVSMTLDQCSHSLVLIKSHAHPISRHGFAMHPHIDLHSTEVAAVILADATLVAHF